MSHRLSLFALLMAFIVWRYRPRGQDVQRQNAGNALALQRALLGPPSRHERIALAITLFVRAGSRWVRNAFPVCGATDAVTGPAPASRKSA